MSWPLEGLSGHRPGDARSRHVLLGSHGLASRRGHQGLGSRAAHFMSRDRPSWTARSSSWFGRRAGAQQEASRSISRNRGGTGDHLPPASPPPATDAVVENFRPCTLERWHIAAGRLRTIGLVWGASPAFVRTDRTLASPRELDAFASRSAGSWHPSPAGPYRPPCGSASRSQPDYHPGVFSSSNSAVARALLRLLPATTRGGKGAVVDAHDVYGAASAAPDWTLRPTDRLVVVAPREGNRLANSAPLLHSTTSPIPLPPPPRRRRKFVCIVAGRRRELLADLNAMYARTRSSTRSPLRAFAQEHRRGADRSTDSSRRGRRRQLPRRGLGSRGIAHDVPVANQRYTAVDIFADRHSRARVDLVSSMTTCIGRSVSRHRPRSPFPLPASSGDPPNVPRGAALSCGHYTYTRSVGSASCSSSTTPKLDDLISAGVT